MVRKRSSTPERKRNYNKSSNLPLCSLLTWFFGLIYLGLKDTNYGKNPDADLTYVGIYIAFTIFLLIMK